SSRPARSHLDLHTSCTLSRVPSSRFPIIFRRAQAIPYVPKVRRPLGQSRRLPRQDDWAAAHARLRQLLAERPDHRVSAPPFEETPRTLWPGRDGSVRSLRLRSPSLSGSCIRCRGEAAGEGDGRESRSGGLGTWARTW